MLLVLAVTLLALALGNSQHEIVAGATAALPFIFATAVAALITVVVRIISN